MTKTEIPCSCGCGKMLMKKESDIARKHDPSRTMQGALPCV